MHDGPQQSLCNAGGVLKTATYLRPFVSFTHHQLSLSSPRAIMSTIASTSTSHLDFTSIFNAALESYKRKTNSKEDLASHPLLPRLQYCDSPDAIISIFREQIAFDRTGDGFTKVTKWVIPTVNVLHAFSGMLGQAAGLVNVWIYPYRELLL